MPVEHNSVMLVLTVNGDHEVPEPLETTQNWLSCIFSSGLRTLTALVVMYGGYWKCGVHVKSMALTIRVNALCIIKVNITSIPAFAVLQPVSTNEDIQNYP
jgi:hypothetical protein